jgi:hypothetical protein
VIFTGAIIPTLMHWIPSELRSKARLGYSSTGMGDLSGIPSVAPSPPFLHGSVGREGGSHGRASHAAPIFPDWSSTPPKGRNVRRTELVSTPLYAASPVATELVPFSPSSSFSLFLFPPCFFFPFASGREEFAPGARVAECDTSPRSHRLLEQHRQGEERRRGVSVRVLLSGVPSPWPDGVHCRGGGVVILAGAIIPALMHWIPSELRS